MSSGSDYVNISNEYAPPSASSTKGVANICSGATANSEIKIEHQKYGAAKPRRILVRAGIIHDQG
jgi:hypothetical protein